MRPEEVRRVAELARLEIRETELDRVAGQLGQVLEFVSALDRLELEGCDPSVFAPAGAALREDAANGRRLTNQAAVAAAPETEAGFFLVPPIVENLNP